MTNPVVAHLPHLATLVITLSCVGCGEWPRYRHLPEEGSTVPSSTDLATLFPVEWGVEAETSLDNDLPHTGAAQQLSLTRNQGAVVEGRLVGLGEDRNEPPVVIQDEGCANSPGQRYPYDVGEYTGDVDYVWITPDGSGVLCAAVELERTVAFDLLLVPLDACGIPGPPATSEGGLLGANTRGDSGGWGTRVEAGGAMAVMLAGWDPVDPSLEVPYRLALSLVSSEPDDSVLCPALPDEEP